MQNSLKLLGIICLIFVLLTQINAQIARDIALKYLYLDQNRDNLVSSKQLKKPKSNNSQSSQQKMPQKIQYYDWHKYLTIIYPNYVFKKFDIDNSNNLSFLQLHKLLESKLKSRLSLSQSSSSSSAHFNILSTLRTQDYFTICNNNNDEYINYEEFLNCFQSFLIYEKRAYPYKIKSLLYPNRTIGYQYAEWRKILPKSWGKIGNDGNGDGDEDDAQKQIKYIFDSFQWPQQKIRQDTDLMIGPEQGKFMQPTILYFYLDKNMDQVIDKSESLKYFSNKNNGGQQAFRIADFTGDQKLDQAELISYFMFAMCIDDCEGMEDGEGNCGKDKGKDWKERGRFEITEGVCGILGNLVSEMKKKLQSILKEKDELMKIKQKVQRSYEQF